MIKVIYLGYNDFIQNKRGVENVIYFQSTFLENCLKYYIHWGNETKVYKYNKFVCISVKKKVVWDKLINLLIINVIIKKIFRRKRGYIHSHNPIMSLFIIWKTDIFTVHDGLYYLNKSKRRLFANLFAFLEILLYKRCKYVHFISKFSKDNSMFPKNRNNYKIIYNTSHFESIVLSETKNDLAISKIDNINKNFKTALIVRSIEERAAIDLILEVSNVFENEIFFLIVGKGPLLDYYKNKQEELKIKNLLFLGYLDDNTLINFYQKADFIIVPAYYGEGFGLPIIEAYYFNKPVFASNICAIPEIIIDPCYLFDNNFESLVNKLRNRSKYKHNYKAFYDINYSNKIISKKYKSMYNSVIKIK